MARCSSRGRLVAVSIAIVTTSLLFTSWRLTHVSSLSSTATPLPSPSAAPSPSPSPQPPSAYPVDAELTPTRISGVPALLCTSCPITHARMLVLLFHGCTHDGSIWRVGPHERYIVRRLLEGNLYPIALTSISNDEKGSNGCWDVTSAAQRNADVHRTLALLSTLLRQLQGGRQVKLAAIGSSSGGYFASLLGLFLDLDVQVLIVAGMHPIVRTALQVGEGVSIDRSIIGALSSPSAALRPYLNPSSPPCTMFLHMPRDSHMDLNSMIASLKWKRVHQNSAFDWSMGDVPLSSNGDIPDARFAWTLAARPTVLFPRSFAAWMPSRLTMRASAALWDALVYAGQALHVQRNSPAARGSPDDFEHAVAVWKDSRAANVSQARVPATASTLHAFAALLVPASVTMQASECKAKLESQEEPEQMFADLIHDAFDEVVNVHYPGQRAPYMHDCACLGGEQDLCMKQDMMLDVPAALHQAAAGRDGRALFDLIRAKRMDNAVASNTAVAEALVEVLNAAEAIHEATAEYADTIASVLQLAADSDARHVCTRACAVLQAMDAAELSLQARENNAAAMKQTVWPAPLGGGGMQRCK